MGYNRRFLRGSAKMGGNESTRHLQRGIPSSTGMMGGISQGTNMKTFTEKEMELDMTKFSDRSDLVLYSQSYRSGAVNK